jgi:ABC-2 type transport system permease protein
MFRLEMADALRSRWIAFTAAVYADIFALFIWLGLRESTVLGFTGLSRVVMSVSNAVILAVPLVSLVATSQTIVRARQSGLFELMLSQPVRRNDWFIGIVASRFVVVVGPLVVLLLLALFAGALSGTKDVTLVPMIVRSLVITSALALAFIGIGFLISAYARSPERATVLALVAWVMSSALHDFALIGALLRFKVAPVVIFALAAANPVEAARIAILGSVDPDLSVLGPVGFWLANTLGPARAFAIGVCWPAFLGTVGLLGASRHLARSDLVA